MYLLDVYAIINRTLYPRRMCETMCANVGWVEEIRRIETSPRRAISEMPIERKNKEEIKVQRVHIASVRDLPVKRAHAKSKLHLIPAIQFRERRFFELAHEASERLARESTARTLV